MSASLELMVIQLDDIGEEDIAIPLANVTSQILEKVLVYATYHQNDIHPDDNEEEELKPKNSDDITTWHA
jgi:S-phase kinase-associated protein 1